MSACGCRWGSVALLTACFIGELDLACAAAPPAFDTGQRVPVTTSRVVGSPEPSLPFRYERVFEKLAFSGPLYMAVEPGTGRLLVVEQHGRTLAFENRFDVSESTVFCQIEDHDTYSLHFHPDYA